MAAPPLLPVRSSLAKAVRRLRVTVFRTENTGRERIKASAFRESLRTGASSKQQLTVAPWPARWSMRLRC